MTSRRFRPTGIDALEERLALTAFVVPFSLVTTESGQVHPKNLFLTGRTESRIDRAITGAFHHFSNDLGKALNTYNVGLASGTAGSTSLTTLQSAETRAFDRLSKDLLGVSRKVPFGGVNLNPVLQDRITGASGVTDTTTKVNTPSLQTQLTTLFNAGQPNQYRPAIDATQALVRSDVKNYINLGVTNGYFKLTRGATFYPLS